MIYFFLKSRHQWGLRYAIMGGGAGGGTCPGVSPPYLQEGIWCIRQPFKTEVCVLRHLCISVSHNVEKYRDSRRIAQNAGCV